MNKLNSELEWVLETIEFYDGDHFFDRMLSRKFGSTDVGRIEQGLNELCNVGFAELLEKDDVGNIKRFRLTASGRSYFIDKKVEEKAAEQRRIDENTFRRKVQIEAAVISGAISLTGVLISLLVK